MAYKKRALYVFEDHSVVGISETPDNTLVLIQSSMDLFLLENLTGLVPADTIQDAIDKKNLRMVSGDEWTEVDGDYNVDTSPLYQMEVDNNGDESLLSLHFVLNTGAGTPLSQYAFDTSVLIPEYTQDIIKVIQLVGYNQEDGTTLVKDIEILAETSTGLIKINLMGPSGTDIALFSANYLRKESFLGDNFGLTFEDFGWTPAANAAPGSILDFAASDDQSNAIVVTWTHTSPGLPTPIYDLIDSDNGTVLAQDIQSGYSYTYTGALNLLVRATNSEGTVDSNIDAGEGQAVLTAPGSILDFAASDDQPDAIVVTWTHTSPGLPTPIYDLVDSDAGTVLAQDIQSGYSYTYTGALNLLVRATNSEGTVDSNIDAGEGQAVLTAPGSILDFAASDDQPDAIVVTWTHTSPGLPTPIYDLVDSDAGTVLAQDIQSGYSYTYTGALNLLVRATNSEGTVDSNIDAGEGISSTGDFYMEVDSTTEPVVYQPVTAALSNPDQTDPDEQLVSLGTLTVTDLGMGTWAVSGNSGVISVGFSDVVDNDSITAIRVQKTGFLTSMTRMFSTSYLSNVTHLTFENTCVTTNVVDTTYMFSAFENSAVTLDFTGLDTSNVTDMSYMFYTSNIDNLDLSDLDVSSVTNMSNMFYYSRGNAIDFTGWDTSSVTDMYRMFEWANAHDLNLSGWDTSSVTNMSRMFYVTYNNNITDVAGWDTSSVTNMSYMFYHSGASVLDLATWDVSSVTDMSNMFYHSGALVLDLATWDVSSVTDMSSMFESPYIETLSMTNWDTSSVRDMSRMFAYISATTLTLTADFLTTGNSTVTDMHGMFYSASGTSLNTLDISLWDVSYVTDMSNMFAATIGTCVEQLDFSNWDTSRVTNMSSMFEACLTTHLDIANLDISSITTFDKMFKNARDIQWIDLPTMFSTVAPTAVMASMFENCYALRTFSYINSTSAVSTQNMFKGAYGCDYPSESDRITIINGTNWTSSSTGPIAVNADINIEVITSLEPGYILTGTGTVNVTNTGANQWVISGTGDIKTIQIVEGASEIYEIDVKQLSGLLYYTDLFNGLTNVNQITFSSGVDSRNISRTDRMFKDCTSLTTLNIDLTSLRTTLTNVVSANYMFENCSALSSLSIIDVSPEWINLTDATGMTTGCTGITDLIFKDLDLSRLRYMSSFALGNTSMQTIDISGNIARDNETIDSLVSGCSSLIALDLKDIVSTGYIRSIYHVCYNCSSLTSFNLGNIRSSSSYNFDYAFKGCSSLVNIDLSTINPSGDTYLVLMVNTFSECSSLTSVRLPDKVGSTMRIRGGYTFEDCINLVCINRYASNGSLYPGVFNNTPSLVAPDAATIALFDNNTNTPYDWTNPDPCPNTSSTGDLEIDIVTNPTTAKPVL